MSKYKVGDKVLVSSLTEPPVQAEVKEVYQTYLVAISDDVRRIVAENRLAPYVEPLKVGDYIQTSIGIMEVVHIRGDWAVVCDNNGEPHRKSVAECLRYRTC